MWDKAGLDPFFPIAAAAFSAGVDVCLEGPGTAVRKLVEYPPISMSEPLAKKSVFSTGGMVELNEYSVIGGRLTPMSICMTECQLWVVSN